MSAAPGAPLEWLIIGGGIHGVHLAVRLLAEAQTQPERLRILDPGPALLSRWRQCSTNTGMQHLRSPAVHHLDVDPWDLLAFAGANHRGKGAPEGSFAPPYSRPSVALFDRHCQEIVARYGLQDLHICDQATRVALGCDHVTVTLGAGAPIQAQRVILALGAGDQPRWPSWAIELQTHSLPIEHVFSPGFRLEPDHWPQRMAVVGGGISAAQVAMRLADAGKEVHLVTRHPLRRHQFDSDPGWIGPKNMRGFSATPDLRARRAMISEARHPGSLPPDVHRALRLAISQQRVQLHLGQPHAHLHQGQIVLNVADDYFPVDGVLLATGFEGARPGGALVDALVQSHALPCSDCGYPVVDPQLRWHPRVYVTGPLAELELGPVARNIVGARRAAERIVPTAIQDSAPRSYST